MNVASPKDDKSFFKIEYYFHTSETVVRMGRGRSSQSNNQTVFQNNAQFWPGLTFSDVEDIDASQGYIQETIAKLLRIVLSADDVVSHHTLRSKVLNSERLSKNHLELAILALTSSNRRLLVRHGHGNFALYEVPEDSRLEAESIAYAEFPTDEATQHELALAKFCSSQRPSSSNHPHPTPTTTTSRGRLSSPRTSFRLRTSHSNNTNKNTNSMMDKQYRTSNARTSSTGKRSYHHSSSYDGTVSITAQLAKKMRVSLDNSNSNINSGGDSHENVVPMSP